MSYSEERPLTRTDLRALAYNHQETRFVGRLAVPEGAGPHPAILVLHDARGLGDGTARRAHALARQGYVALAADLYGDEAYFPDPKLAGPTLAPLLDDPAKLRERTIAAFEALCALDIVDPGKVGAVGFCLGGRCVLELARSGAALQAGVSLHGLLTTAMSAREGSVRARLLILTGAHDPYAPAEDVEALQREMTAASVDHHITIYSDGWHGFSDDEAGDMRNVPGVRYDPLLDRLSWAQTLAFFDALLA
jgi:dienelactone hydrolase